MIAITTNSSTSVKPDVALDLDVSLRLSILAPELQIQNPYIIAQ